MSKANEEVTRLAALFLMQTRRARAASDEEMATLSSWMGAFRALDGGPPTPHERALRAAWLSSRRQRVEAEDKLTEAAAALEWALLVWDREGPSA